MIWCSVTWLGVSSHRTISVSWRLSGATLLSENHLKCIGMSLWFTRSLMLLVLVYSGCAGSISHIMVFVINRWTDYMGGRLAPMHLLGML
jgi:hypothetical protein